MWLFSFRIQLDHEHRGLRATFISDATHTFFLLGILFCFSFLCVLLPVFYLSRLDSDVLCGTASLPLLMLLARPEGFGSCLQPQHKAPQSMEIIKVPI